MRAKTEIEEIRGSRFAIIVTEIPYQVNKSSLIEKMAELVREDKLDQISDIRDESDRTGMRIVIELKRGAAPKKVRNRLFKHTQMQTSFGVNMLALVDGEPVTLSLRRALVVYIEHRVEVLTRRTHFQLAKARERAHILEGLRIALEFLDEVIATIRASDSADAARTALMERFGLSQVQAQAILDMQLRRLAALERQKIEDEYQEVMARIAYYLDLLDHPEKIRALVREDIMTLKEKYGDERRTRHRPGRQRRVQRGRPHRPGQCADLLQRRRLYQAHGGRHLPRPGARRPRHQGHDHARRRRGDEPLLCPHARQHPVLHQQGARLQQPRL